MTDSLSTLTKTLLVRLHLLCTQVEYHQQCTMVDELVGEGTGNPGVIGLRQLARASKAMQLMRRPGEIPLLGESLGKVGLWL